MLTNIKKVNNKYVIEKTIYGQKINYGIFNTKEEALNHKKLLIKYNWIKNNSTGYKKEDHFPRYCVRKDNQDKYIVKNRQTGKTYGSYKSKKYANIIKRILPFYTNTINIENIEKQAVKEFYKYITKDYLNGYYKFTYQNTVILTSKSLITILQERDLYIKSNGDEELMCENVTDVYPYNQEKLPPFHEYTNITYEEKSKYKYMLRKQIRNHRMIIGKYPTYKLADLVKKYLERNNWNMNSIKHIIKVTDEIQNRNKNIITSGNKHYIKRCVKKQSKYYGSYDDINLTRYVRNRLKEDNWNKSLINQYKKEYYSNKILLYYYDNTDLFATTD